MSVSTARIELSDHPDLCFIINVLSQLLQFSTGSLAKVLFIDKIDPRLRRILTIRRTQESPLKSVGPNCVNAYLFPKYNSWLLINSSYERVGGFDCAAIPCDITVAANTNAAKLALVDTKRLINKESDYRFPKFKRKPTRTKAGAATVRFGVRPMSYRLLKIFSPAAKNSRYYISDTMPLRPS